MGTQKQKKGLNISTRSFLTAIAVIFVLMVLTYILTFLIPGGEYARLTDASGNTVIDTEAGFSYVEGGIPFWKWSFSPLLVLSSEGSGALIAVIVFLLVIGGVFNSLEKCNLMKYMLDRITSRFGQKRYQLLTVITLFFMALGSFIGSFEECIPLVPIVVALAVSLGWDPLTGVGMSLLAVGCGFAAGVCNPFTVGVAQELAGLPMFSGIWFRALAFVLIMNFFIPSGSAKAFLLMPLIVPVAQVFRISAQLCVAAFAFGDGFSNVFYPTNPVLLIGLGLADVNYGTWVKWSWKFQTLNLVLTSLLLLFGMGIGY